MEILPNDTEIKLTETRLYTQKAKQWNQMMAINKNSLCRTPQIIKALDMDISPGK